MSNTVNIDVNLQTSDPLNPLNKLSSRFLDALYCLSFYVPDLTHTHTKHPNNRKIKQTKHFHTTSQLITSRTICNLPLQLATATLAAPERGEVHAHRGNSERIERRSIRNTSYIHIILATDRLQQPLQYTAPNTQ